MAGSTRRVASAAFAIGVGITALVGCSGDSDVVSFDADVGAAQDANDLFQQSLLRAVEMCGGDDPPIEVKWEFSGKDEESPVAQEYIRANMPNSIPCDAAANVQGSQLPGASQPTATGAQAQQGNPAESAPTTTAP